MDIFSPTIIDNAIITGSNNASLLQVSSPSATSAFFISGSGNVGIGTTSPTARLHISGANNGALLIASSSTAPSALFVSGSGNVGIGTSTPFQKLYVDGDIGLKTANFLNLAGDQGSSRTAGFQASFASYDKIFVYTNNSVIGSLSRDNGWGIGFSTQPSSRLQVRGGGATSATTALRVENANASASLVVLDDGTFGIGNTTGGSEIGVFAYAGSNSFRFNNALGSRGIQITTNTGVVGNTQAGGVIASRAGGGLILMGDVNNTNYTNLVIASGSGNIGIGTTSPSVRLHLSQSSGTFQRVDINNANADGVNATTEYYTNTGATPDLFGATSFRLQGGTTDVFKQFQVYIANLTSPKFIINGSGNVGIGTTSPNARLHISGANNGALLIASSSTAPSALFVSGSGNVGIGTATPARTLYVSSSVWDNTSGAGVVIENSNTVGSGLTLKPSNSVVTNGSNGWAMYAGGPGAAISDGNLGFWAHGTNEARLVIQRAGNVGIGTTSPTARLQVKGSGATSVTTALRVENSNASASLVVLDDGTSAFNTNHLYVSGSGLVGVGTTLPTAELHISGANADTLLRVSSATQTNVLLVSGSGFIGVNRVPGVALDVQGSIRSDGTMFNSTTQTQVISANSIAFLRFFSASVETARYDNNGWGFFNTAPTAKVHISGANTDNLFRVSSPSATNALFVSGSGRVGVGTTTPRELLHVGGGNLSLDSTRYIDFGNGNSRINDLGLVSGQGYSLRITTFGPIGTGTANSLTEKLRLTGSGSLGLGTDSPSARFHISGGFTDGDLMRVQSPTGAEYFFISASGNVGIGTATPVHNLVVNGNTGVSINAGGATFPNIHRDSADGGMLLRSWNGSTFTNNVKITPTTEVGIGTTTPTAELHISGASNITLLRVGSPAQSNILFVTGSGNVGIGTNLPSAELHISGASVDSLLRVGSPSNANILFVTGSGNIGINTTSSMAFFSGSGGAFGSGEGNIVPTLTIFQSSSATGLNAAGLQIVGSGSSALAAARLNILTMGDKYAYLNIGTSGSGTENNYWEFAKRPSSAVHSLLLSNYSNGVYQSSIMNLSPGANTSTIGSSNQIFLEGSTGYIGLQTSTPGTSDWIHLHSKPSDGNYINIDATQNSNPPPLTAATAKTGYGITTNSYYLAEPDFWMEIKLDGAIVLVPCYLPAP